MKKLFLLLLFFVFISMPGFSAQEERQEQQEKQARYSIGSSDHPVTAKEYCCFLHQNEYARYNYVGLWPGDWFYESNYYDHQLMDSGPGKSPVITRTGTPGAYDYAVVAGCDDVVIKDLASQIAQKDFRCWRNNLSLGDIRDYLNAQIAIQWANNHSSDYTLEDAQQLEQDAATIRSHYIADFKNEFAKMDNAVSILLKHTPQSYTILEGKQDYNVGAVRYRSGALLISFPSSAEKPVVSLVDTKNEYERLNDIDDHNNGDATHLQFPHSLGGAVVPDLDCSNGGSDL